MERALIGDYEALVAELLATLAPHNHPLAVELARVPEQIRGYGHVKERTWRRRRRRRQAPRGVPRGDARGSEDDGARGRLGGALDSLAELRDSQSVGALSPRELAAIGVLAEPGRRRRPLRPVGRAHSTPRKAARRNRPAPRSAPSGGRCTRPFADRSVRQRFRSNSCRRHDQRLERHRRLLGAFRQVDGGEEPDLPAAASLGRAAPLRPSTAIVITPPRFCRRIRRRCRRGRRCALVRRRRTIDQRPMGSPRREWRRACPACTPLTSPMPGARRRHPDSLRSLICQT